MGSHPALTRSSDRLRTTPAASPGLSAPGLFLRTRLPSDRPAEPRRECDYRLRFCLGSSSATTWLTISAGSKGSGNGAVTVSAAANPPLGLPRTGSFLAAGVTVTVIQQSAADACPATLSPTSLTVPSTLTTPSVSVTVSANCTWTASSPTSWITVTSSATNVNSGTVSLSIAANAGNQRTGTVNIACKIFAITQQGSVNSCPAAVSPATLAAGPSGAPAVAANAVTQSTCSWSATSNDAWLVIVNTALAPGVAACNSASPQIRGPHVAEH